MCRRVDRRGLERQRQERLRQGRVREVPIEGTYTRRELDKKGGRQMAWGLYHIDVIIELKLAEDKLQFVLAHLG